MLETRRGHSQHQTLSSKNEKDTEMAEDRSKKEQIVEPVFFFQPGQCPHFPAFSV